MQVGYPRKAGIAQDDRSLAGTHARVANRNHRLVLGDLRQTVYALALEKIAATKGKAFYRGELAAGGMLPARFWRMH